MIPAPSYATIDDLYRYGLPRGLLANPARLVSVVRPATDTIELDGHGIGDGTEITFRAQEGGTLPAPLLAGAPYYGIAVDDARFGVAASPGGPPLDFTTAGSLVLVAVSIRPVMLAELERYSRLFDSYVIGHAVPLVPPFPTVAIGSVAKLAAASLLEIFGQSSALVRESAEATRRELPRLGRGIALRDERATTLTNLAVGRSAPTAEPGGRAYGTACYESAYNHSDGFNAFRRGGTIP